AQMVRWQQAPMSAGLLANAKAVFRPDLHDEALGSCGGRPAGEPADGIGAFAGPAFDPDNIAAHLAVWATCIQKRRLPGFFAPHNRFAECEWSGQQPVAEPTSPAPWFPSKALGGNTFFPFAGFGTKFVERWPGAAAVGARQWSNDGPTGNAAVLRENAQSVSGGGLLLVRPGRLTGEQLTRRKGDQRMTIKTTGVAPARSGLSRGAFLGRTAGAAALVAAIKAFPGGVHVAHAAGPEVTKAILGYIALIDASALVIAKEKGFFAKHGMPDVDVAKQASWGATRDNILLGSESNGIDGAHILSPMPYLISTGKVTQNNVPMPMYLLAR